MKLFLQVPTSTSVQIKTLVSATMMDEGTMMTCSATTIVVESGGGYGAVVAWGGCMGPASATHGAGADESSLKVAALEDGKAGSSTRVAG